jgi:holo-[acyl-carrier protein] synthase
MIIGIGHDIVFVPRMAEVIERWQQRVLDRVFSPGEQAYCHAHREHARHFAARFAAKEAFYKAASRGKPLPLRFRDAEVVHARGQELRLELSDRARDITRDLGIVAVHLSLSHDGEYASAFVVIEGG